MVEYVNVMLPLGIRSTISPFAQIFIINFFVFLTPERFIVSII